jgi:uncharacterized lipoprotein
MRTPALLASSLIVVALAGCNPKEPTQPNNPPAPQTQSNELFPAQPPRGPDTPPSQDTQPPQDAQMPQSNPPPAGNTPPASQGTQ